MRHWFLFWQYLVLLCCRLLLSLPKKYLKSNFCLTLFFTKNRTAMCTLEKSKLCNIWFTAGNLGLVLNILVVFLPDWPIYRAWSWDGRFYPLFYFLQSFNLISLLSFVLFLAVFQPDFLAFLKSTFSPVSAFPKLILFVVIKNKTKTSFSKMNRYMQGIAGNTLMIMMSSFNFGQRF